MWTGAPPGNVGQQAASEFEGLMMLSQSSADPDLNRVIAMVLIHRGTPVGIRKMINEYFVAEMGGAKNSIHRRILMAEKTYLGLVEGWWLPVCRAMLSWFHEPQYLYKW